MRDKLVRGVVVLLAVLGLLFVADGIYAGISGESGYLYSLFITTELDIRSGATLDINGDATMAGDFTVEDGGEVVGSSTLFVGTGTFTGTELLDTVVVSGILATDDFLISGEATAADPQDVLMWKAVADTLFVYRPASGASGLTYTYLRIK